MSNPQNRHLPFGQRLFRRVLGALFGLLTDYVIEGQEHIPQGGPLIVVTNHLHTLDGPAVFLALSRQPTVFAADKYRRRGSFYGFLLKNFANAIWVARGEADRHALRAALDALAAGEMLVIAPEGTRSKTGGLQQAHDGVTYLAARSGAALLPMVAWGQEKIWHELARGRRAHVRVVIGQPFTLPPEARRARNAQLSGYTTGIMRELAGMLPETYRGVYGNGPQEHT